MVEHHFHIRDTRRVELAKVELCDRPAIIEHAFHRNHLLCLEGTNIYLLQHVASGKHERHVGDIGGVEPAEVKAADLVALIEHGLHGGRL